MADRAPASENRPAGLDENIDRVLEVRRREEDQLSSGQRSIEHLSRIIGQPLYLVCLFVFALLWIAFNLWAPRIGRQPFDPSPFPLLDGILSLAALVSTTIILIAQNRQTRIEQRHAHISLQVNLLTEQKAAKIIDLLEELRRDMPMVKDRYDPQAATFSEKTNALQVLSAIEEVGLTATPSGIDAASDKK
jgi:uncharacterized membrane protein